MRLTSREDHLLRSEPADGLTSDGSELSGNAGLKRANRTEVGKLQGGGRAERHVSDGPITGLSIALSTACRSFGFLAPIHFRYA